MNISYSEVTCSLSSCLPVTLGRVTFLLCASIKWRQTVWLEGYLQLLSFFVVFLANFISTIVLYKFWVACSLELVPFLIEIASISDHFHLIVLRVLILTFLSVQIPEWQFYYLDLWAICSLTLVLLNFFYAGIAHLYLIHLRNSYKNIGLRLVKGAFVLSTSAISSSFCSVRQDPSL